MRVISLVKWNLQLFGLIVKVKFLQVDYEMALEYATHRGVTDEPRENLFIQSLKDENKCVDFQSPAFVFRLFQ